jgi:hypothetical protein
MNTHFRRTLSRRTILAIAGYAPFLSVAGGRDNLVLSDFTAATPVFIPSVRWSGFTDRVMGGVSDADFGPAEIDGLRCTRMQGRVTRDNGGGFVQMAMYFDPLADASAYRGIEILVYGNDEDYNAHVRTADCGWHDESYRTTFHAEPHWQTIRLPWESFRANGLSAPLDTSRLQRIGLLGWMREFQADLALGAIAFYT